MPTLLGMFTPRPVSDSEVVEALLRQLAGELRTLAERLARFAAEREEARVPLRPWWDAPVRGLPLEEALQQYAQSKISG